MIKTENNGTEATMGHKEFSVINFLRFLAAAWVLIFHAQIHFGQIEHLWIMNPLIGQGVLAMSLFFILSGFILSYRYRDFSQSGTVTKFYIARIARLYPVYVFMGIVTVWTLSDRMSDFPLAEEGGVGAAIWIALVTLMFVTATQAWFPSLFTVWNF